MPIIRRASHTDLAAIAGIQMESSEAAQWNADVSGDDLLVAEVDGRVAGFLAGRTVAPEEHEILNLAVAIPHRRKGVASHLFQAWISTHAGDVYLEVRESNTGARNLYKSLGFQEIGLRREYYSSPLEAAIVLRFHSC